MHTDTLTPTVAANVDKAMKAAGENLSSMERGTGLSRSKLRNRLTGKFPWSTFEMTVVASHLGTTPDALCAPPAEAEAS